MHDQTLRLANHGHLATEIADMLTLPPELTAQSHTVGYYGSLIHNVKAVYQRYLSWYDGNPANLWRLPPVEAGRRYVELAGGADALLEKARAAFDAGEYRWVAELVNHLVFADPSNEVARQLQADALEQLGYQSESATFRNAFLMGAQELRGGTMPSLPATRHGYLDAMTVGQFFDTIGVRLRAEAVGGQSTAINFTVTDAGSTTAGEDWVLRLSNRALHAVAGTHDADAALTVRLSKARLFAMAEQQPDLTDDVTAGTVTTSGDLGAALTIFGNLDVFMSNFPLVEP
jgi:alkyl sulfatase BDS1-like metallo-beta-lactamase superfamily hydrolase